MSLPIVLPQWVLACHGERKSVPLDLALPRLMTSLTVISPLQASPSVQLRPRLSPCPI
jgi:hypothetical protein